MMKHGTYLVDHLSQQAFRQGGFNLFENSLQHSTELEDAPTPMGQASTEPGEISLCIFSLFGGMRTHSICIFSLSGGMRIHSICIFSLFGGMRIHSICIFSLFGGMRIHSIFIFSVFEGMRIHSICILSVFEGMRTQSTPFSAFLLFIIGKSIDFLPIALEVTPKIKLRRIKMKGEASIAAKMHQVHTLLTNIQQPDLKALILTFGYDDVRLAEGQALYDNAKSLMDAQKGGYANQFQATRVLNDQAVEAEKVFATNVVIARRVLGDKQINELGITGSRKKNFNQWTEQAHNFYGIALSKADVMAALSAFGVTAEIFQASLDTINMLLALSITQKNMIGNAQVATERRNEAFKALFKWCSKLITICRFSFEREPQHLERLGKVVYSEGYKKKPVDDVPVPDPDPEEPTLPEPLEVVGNEDCPAPSKFKSKGGKRQ